MARRKEKAVKERPPLGERPLFKWAKENGLNIVDGVLEVVADKTGIDALRDIIKKDPKFPELTAQQQIEFEQIYQAERTALDAEVTQRWISDNQTESWLTKNVRPLSLCLWSASTITMAFLQGSGCGFKLPFEIWMEMFVTTGALNAAYFGFREHGKRNRTKAMFGGGNG